MWASLIWGRASLKETPIWQSPPPPFPKKENEVNLVEKCFDPYSAEKCFNPYSYLPSHRFSHLYWGPSLYWIFKAQFKCKIVIGWANCKKNVRRVTMVFPRITSLDCSSTPCSQELCSLDFFDLYLSFPLWGSPNYTCGCPNQLDWWHHDQKTPPGRPD